MLFFPSDTGGQQPVSQDLKVVPDATGVELFFVARTVSVSDQVRASARHCHGPLRSSSVASLPFHLHPRLPKGTTTHTTTVYVPTYDYIFVRIRLFTCLGVCQRYYYIMCPHMYVFASWCMCLRAAIFFLMQAYKHTLTHTNTKTVST